jgi:hypothetical protein
MRAGRLIERVAVQPIPAAGNFRFRCRIKVLPFVLSGHSERD